MWLLCGRFGGLLWCVFGLTVWRGGLLWRRCWRGSEFQRALGYRGKSSRFVERIFALFDGNGDRRLTFPEFVKGISLLSANGTQKEKARCAWDGRGAWRDLAWGCAVQRRWLLGLSVVCVFAVAWRVCLTRGCSSSGSCIQCPCGAWTPLSCVILLASRCS